MQIYVGTYGKYNDGNLAGKWLQISDYQNKHEFVEACRKLHEDEHDPEFMFQDWEGLPDNTVGESHLDDLVFDFANIDQDDRDIIDAYMDATGQELDDALENALDSFRGYFDSVQDFGEELAADILEIPSNIEPYFDYEAYGRDCLLDMSHTTINHKIWVFWN
tara:strand:+ start:525 stop:1013 length:489 start_codon:yes stop_codon:yes gene_type:complete